ncbi:AraC family transcriptional regulator [Clostridium estertheticum]|uniref:AraC family transcriptional regulator n=1 Tax=Clostridium estertheticum TaxID=238834 RepID=UPI001CF249B3|nr:AraC family transcriptional regulator [Clostridium estertheticum]MCB2305388.1 AraC family transcriptional regulator [Clostridium estertheticum]MCB2343826.1 AraC family transcriptional regulator [Clostridium estertheticum]MCB2348744.1 AraC family transcriptional regulator [Clostridium estertheticum]WAG46066.1 AraC family transcriptional regulator [Clostridium estertheticum]
MNKNIKDHDKIEKAFEITKIKQVGNVSMKTNHYHDDYEIYYLLDGKRHYFIKDKVYDIKKGDLVFVKKNEIHKTFDAGAPYHQRILITFKKSYLNNILVEAKNYDLLSCFHGNTNVLRLKIDEQKSIESLLSKMLYEDTHQVDSSSIYLKIMLTEFLILVERLLKNAPSYHIETTNLTHKRISEIITYINKNYVENLTLDFLSKRFFISTYYLSRTFKNVTGLNLNQYVNTIRIKAAQKLLFSAELNITNISEEVGYRSITHFGRVFKSITGVSPLKYKKILS